MPSKAERWNGLRQISLIVAGMISIVALWCMVCAYIGALVGPMNNVEAEESTIVTPIAEPSPAPMATPIPPTATPESPTPISESTLTPSGSTVEERAYFDDAANYSQTTARAMRRSAS
jgi:hypothetical protein